MHSCVQTIYLFTSAYPAVISGSNAATLLPYLKNATTVSKFAFPLTYKLMVFLVRGADDLRLPFTNLPSFDPPHAQNGGQVRTRAAAGTATNDSKAVAVCRRTGELRCISLSLLYILKRCCVIGASGDGSLPVRNR